MSILLTILRGAWSKVGMYLFAVAAFGTAILAVLATVSRAAKTSQKLEQATQKLKAAQEANKLEAHIDRLSDAELDRRLSDRWGR
jgi:ABC-type protease/lipase transport system fused ATPase/permease subunit